MRSAVKFIVCAIVCSAIIVCGQTTQRRSRGEGFYNCETANTVGSGSIWATARITGFIWDAVTSTQGAGTVRTTTPMPQGFVDARADVGLFDLAAIKIESQTLTFLWGKHIQFGNVRGAVKLTTPNNMDLRLFGSGLELAYKHSFMKDFNSLGGYRKGGTGFSPIGIIYEGGCIEAKALADFDLIAVHSKLPLKALINMGLRVPIDAQFREFSQYIMQAGIGFIGVSVDVFAEYSFEGFINRDVYPKKFEPDWLGRSWEVAFSENPMYVTIGGRYRYPSGVTLYAAVPLLISVNQGSTMEYDDWEIQTAYPEEWARGIRQGFDPWFAKWKLVLQATMPIWYKQTAAEMRRNFLLLKNRTGGKKIDLDERLKLLEQTPSLEKSEEEKEQEEADKKQRLDDIRKRRQQIQQSK